MAVEYQKMQSGSIVYENKPNKVITATITHRLQCGAHLHKEIELVYVLSGETKAYLDSEEFTLYEGDLFFSFPNRVHYYRTYLPEESVLMIFPPELFADYSNILIKNVPISPVIRKEKLPENIRDILCEVVRIRHSDLQYAFEINKGYLNVFLGEVLPLFEYRKVLSSNTDMLSSILNYCLQNYTESISLDEMAQKLHASKYYISRLFNDKIKIGFNDYINILRVNEAKERLASSDDSITEIGSSVGYNTIRSFNRAFRDLTGMSPRDYRYASRGQVKKSTGLPVWCKGRLEPLTLKIKVQRDE